MCNAPLAKPGNVAPGPGDLVACNYTWRYKRIYRIDKVYPDDCTPGMDCLACTIISAPGAPSSLGGNGAYFHGYHLRNSRYIGPWYPHGTAGRKSNDNTPPWNGDGYDELMIVERCRQGRLF